MAVKKGGLGKGLGKGLDTLIPVGVLEKDVVAPSSDTASSTSETGGKEMLVKISKVEPNRAQPRKQFNEDSLDELADSIRKYGVIQPLLVQKKDDHYEIIAGERRWRAAKLAGLKEIPVLVREYTEEEIMEIALIENIQRENLNPIEEAQAYQKLIDEYHVKHEELAERVSKSRSFITNSMRLLKLQKQVQDMVIEGVLSSGHARAILGLPIAEDQLAAANRVVDEGMSVRQTEIMVKDWYRPKPVRKVATQSEKQNQLFYKELEKKLSTCTETKVKIKDNGKNKGKIEIEYYTLEDLERIQAILEGKSKNE